MHDLSLISVCEGSNGNADGMGKTDTNSTSVHLYSAPGRGHCISGRTMLETVSASGISNINLSHRRFRQLSVSIFSLTMSIICVLFEGAYLSP